MKRWSLPAWGAVLAVVLIATTAFLRRGGSGSGGLDGSTLALTLAGLVALLGLLIAFAVVGMHRVLGSLRSSTVRTLAGFTMPSADQPTPPRPVRRYDPAAVVDALERVGFRRVGAYELRLPDHRAVFGGLLHADGSTLAVVTPAHTALTTDFTGKLVTTSDNGSEGVMPYELRRVLAGSTPADLLEFHRAEVDAAARATGSAPTTHTPDSALDTMLAIDRHGVATVTLGLLFRSFLRQSLGLAALFPPAAERMHARRRRAWAASPDRWTPPAA